jgi:NADPH:quinone reductase-like Zn-dependent oxidoreductase
MRAFAVTDFEQPGSVTTLPDPEPGEGEVRIRVHSASVNPFDGGVATGSTRSWAETRLPLVPGVDAAGVIDAVGAGVEGFKPGDRVATNAGGKGFWGAGTFAELVVVPADAAAQLPDSMDFDVAASVPQTGLTALGAMDALGPVTGRVIVVSGATGGVGGWFTQLASLAGAKVVALARPENADYARELGAADVIDHTAPDMVDRIRAAHPGGVDALADFSGSPELVATLSAVVRDGGRVASSIGKAREAVPAERGLTAHAANMVDRSRLAEVLEPLAAGRIKPPKLTIVPLEQAGEALAQARHKQGVGKTIIRIA